jgi:hypothetical protein
MRSRLRRRLFHRLPGLRHRAPQDIRVLRARHAQAAGEDEERHAGHPDRLRLGDLALDRILVRILVEELLDKGGVEPALPRNIEQHSPVADVASFDEIGAEEPVDHLALRARR